MTTCPEGGQHVELDRSRLDEKMAFLLGEVVEENLRPAGAAECFQSPAISRETALIGPDAVVNSITLVSFITDVEMMLSDEWEIEITLVSEEALSRKRSPFRTLGSLTELVLELAGKAAEKR